MFSLTRVVSRARALWNSQVQLPRALCASPNRLGWRRPSVKWDRWEMGKFSGWCPREREEKGHFFSESPLFPHILQGCEPLASHPLPSSSRRWSWRCRLTGHTCLLWERLPGRWQDSFEAATEGQQGRKGGHSGKGQKKGEKPPSGESEARRRIKPWGKRAGSEGPDPPRTWDRHGLTAPWREGRKARRCGDSRGLRRGGTDPAGRAALGAGRGEVRRGADGSGPGGSGGTAGSRRGARRGEVGPQEEPPPGRGAGGCRPRGVEPGEGRPPGRGAGERRSRGGEPGECRPRGGEPGAAPGGAGRAGRGAERRGAEEGGCIVPRAVHAGPASAPNMASRCHLCVWGGSGTRRLRAGTAAPGGPRSAGAAVATRRSSLLPAALRLSGTQAAGDPPAPALPPPWGGSGSRLASALRSPPALRAMGSPAGASAAAAATDSAQWLSVKEETIFLHDGLIRVTDLAELPSEIIGVAEPGDTELEVRPGPRPPEPRGRTRAGARGWKEDATGGGGQRRWGLRRGGGCWGGAGRMTRGGWGGRGGEGRMRIQGEGCGASWSWGGQLGSSQSNLFQITVQVELGRRAVRCWWRWRVKCRCYLLVLNSRFGKSEPRSCISVWPLAPLFLLMVLYLLAVRFRRFTINQPYN